MKTPITLLTIIACAGLANAQCSEGSCDAGKCCDTAATTNAQAKGDVVYVGVDGMSCGACSGKVTKALKAMDGVTVKQVCHKSGSAKVMIDPKKTNRADVIKTITDNGYQVTGDIVTMKVDGMTCGACSGKLTKALEGMDGVSVKQVCHKTGTATLIKSEKVDEEALTKTVTNTGYTVKK